MVGDLVVGLVGDLDCFVGFNVTKLTNAEVVCRFFIGDAALIPFTAVYTIIKIMNMTVTARTVKITKNARLTFILKIFVMT